MKRMTGIGVSIIALAILSVATRVSFGAAAQIMQAVSPEGQFISFRYQVKGQTMVCGIHVSELDMGHKLDSSGVFTSVEDLKLASNKMNCAYGPKEKPLSAVTTFTGVDFSSGRIIMTVAAVPLSAPNSKFQLTLTSSFSGTMVPFTGRTAPARQK